MKCNYGDFIIKPDGINELDACKYEEIQKVRNVTITVLRCKKCGHVELEWKRQENSEDIDL